MFSGDRNKSIPAIVSIWKILIYFIYPHSIVWVQLACHWFLRSRICVSLNAFFHSQWGWIWWTNLIDVRLNSSGLIFTKLSWARLSSVNLLRLQKRKILILFLWGQRLIFITLNPFRFKIITILLKFWNLWIFLINNSMLEFLTLT